jgi:hypothetical protein
MRRTTILRSVVGLLAAVGTAMPVAASLAHGDVFWAVLVDGAAATGLAAYLALPALKKSHFHLLLARNQALKLALLLLRARADGDLVISCLQTTLGLSDVATDLAISTSSSRSRTDSVGLCCGQDWWSGSWRLRKNIVNARLTRGVWCAFRRTGFAASQPGWFGLRPTPSS